MLITPSLSFNHHSYSMWLALSLIYHHWILMMMHAENCMIFFHIQNFYVSKCCPSSNWCLKGSHPMHAAISFGKKYKVKTLTIILFEVLLQTTLCSDLEWILKSMCVCVFVCPWFDCVSRFRCCYHTRSEAHFIDSFPLKCHFRICNCLHYTLIARFMGPTWGPTGSCRPQVGPMLAP